MRSIVLDNEAIQALTDARSPKHRVVVAHLAGAVARRRRVFVWRKVVSKLARDLARLGKVLHQISRFPHHHGAVALGLPVALVSAEAADVGAGADNVVNDYRKLANEMIQQVSA